MLRRYETLFLVIALGMAFISGMLFKKNDFGVMASGLWLGAIVSLFLGFGNKIKFGVNIKTIIVLALILLLTVLPKLWKVSSTPSGVWMDEIQISMAGKHALDRSLNQKILIPFTTEATGHPGLTLLFTGVGIDLWGQTTMGLRFPSILFSGLAAGLMFIWVSSWSNKKIGLIAALMFAYSQWGIALSRIAFEAGYYWFFEIAGLIYLTRIRKADKKENYLILGIVLGMGNYSYLAFRVITFAFMIVEAVILFGQKKHMYQIIERVALTGLAFSIVFLPLLIYSRLNPDFFNARSQSVSLTAANLSFGQKGQIFIDGGVKTAAMMLGLGGDPNARHNPAQSSELMWGGSLLMLLGLSVLVRKKKWIELVGWIVLTGVSGLSGILTYENGALIQPHSLRTAGLLPLVVTAGAIGLMWMETKWSKKVTRVVLGAVLLMAVVNYKNYLASFESPAAQKAYQYAETKAAIEGQRNESYSIDHLQFFRGE